MQNYHPLYNGCDSDYNLTPSFISMISFMASMTNTITSQLHNKPITGMKDAWTLTISPSEEININKMLCLPTMGVQSVDTRGDRPR